MSEHGTAQVIRNRRATGQSEFCPVFILSHRCHRLDVMAHTIAPHMQSRANRAAIARTRHSTRKPSFLISADHFASSRSMSAAYSSGLDGSGSPPSAAMRARDLGEVDELAQFRVEPRDDRLRRAGRRQQPVVQHRLEARQARLDEGRHVGKQARARRPGSRDGAQVPACRLPIAGASTLKRDRHMAAEQIVGERRRALVGDDGDVDAGHRLEQLAGEIAAGAGRRRAEIELAGLLLRERDQVGDRFRRERRDAPSARSASTR